MNAENYPNDDLFLARWMNSELSKEELDSFEKSEDFAIYSKILDGVSKLKPPTHYEDDADKAYLDFLEKLSNRKQTSKKTKVIPLNAKTFLSIAASIALIFGIFLYSGETTYQSGVGEKLTIKLPDNTEAIINAKSKLHYNRYLYAFNRSVRLNGEGYFKVIHGDKFSVATPNGSIEVLGTQFNVVSRSTYFETNCYEGKVRVVKNTFSDTLIRGEQIRFVNQDKLITDQNHSDEQPAWISGVSKFKNTPLSQVLKEFENQFGVKFDTSKLTNLSKLYTGAFIHDKDNIESALENVFLPLGISYDYQDNETAIKLKELKLWKR